MARPLVRMQYVQESGFVLCNGEVVGQITRHGYSGSRIERDAAWVFLTHEEKPVSFIKPTLDQLLITVRKHYEDKASASMPLQVGGEDKIDPGKPGGWSPQF